MIQSFFGSRDGLEINAQMSSELCLVEMAKRLALDQLRAKCSEFGAVLGIGVCEEVKSLRVDLRECHLRSIRIRDSLPR